MNPARRVVFDTNVVVSRMLIRNGTRAEGALVRAFDEIFQACETITTKAMLEELRRVALRPKFDGYRDLASRLAFLEVYASAATVVEITLPIRECRDPKDDKFLEAALAGHADLVLTGDQDLLVLHPWRGVAIVTPAAYLERMG